MSLVTNSSANNIKYITINGTEYSYDHQSMITPYNFSPAYVVGSSYSTEPGKCTIKLETENADSVRTVVYEGTTEVDLKAGVISQVIVWENNEYDENGQLVKAGAAPHVHEFGVPPLYNEVTQQVMLVSHQLVCITTCSMLRASQLKLVCSSM